MSGGDTDDWESAPTSHCICYDLSCSPTAPSPFPGGPAPQQSVSQLVTSSASLQFRPDYLPHRRSLAQPLPHCASLITTRSANHSSSNRHICTLPRTGRPQLYSPPPPDALHCLETTSWHRSTCPLTVPPSRVATRGSSTASYPSQTLQPTPNGPCSQYKLPCSTPSKVAGPRRASSRSKPKEVSFIPSPLPRRAARRHPADDLPRT